MVEQVALKPCPFCGSEDVHHQSDYGDENQIVCAVCDTRGPLKRSPDASAHGWNTRTTAALEARVRELEGALRPFARAEHIVATVDEDRIRCVLTYPAGSTETFTLASLYAARAALNDSA